MYGCKRKEKKREREKREGKYLSRDIYWQDGPWLVGVAAGVEREDEEHSSQKEELHVLFLSFVMGCAEFY